MLIAENSVTTEASKSSVWKIWEDVANWNSWDHGIEFSSIEGPFAVGTAGKLKPKGGPILRTMLTEVTLLESFVDEARLPLTRIIVSHVMHEEGGMTKITNRVEMRGFLAPLFAILIGRDMKKNMPEEMAAMTQKAEQL